MRRIIERYPMMITPYYLSLVDKDDPDDPIARMCVPSPDEFDPGGSFDTSGEASNTKLEGLQHKYGPTVLLLSTNVCAMYCRHCFRKRLVGLSDEELLERADEAIAYISSHREVNNVLVSGGDSLMNPNTVVRRYLSGPLGHRAPGPHPLRLPSAGHAARAHIRRRRAAGHVRRILEEKRPS